MSHRGLQETLERGSPVPGPVLVIAMTKHHHRSDFEKDDFIGVYCGHCVGEHSSERSGWS